VCILSNAEGGPICKKYPLIETPAASYVRRAEWNVRDTGGTVIFSIGPAQTGGTLKQSSSAKSTISRASSFSMRDALALEASGGFAYTD
jgi:hypothetical protein